jgi:deazaflavin-dependent oxidoreductase (nitroreductase family)
MPFPRFVATINRHLTNPVVGMVAGNIVPLSIIEHRGRHSGTIYATPIMAFPNGADFVVVLTYGARTDWVRNVMAAGGCGLTYDRHHFDLTDPRIVKTRPASLHLPAWTKPILVAVHATEYLLLRKNGRSVEPCAGACHSEQARNDKESG